MLEILFCSLLTVLPDYLFRRYYQGKRIGKEMTFYSVWFELRWGITGCVVLAVGLITVVFYNHPSTHQRHTVLQNDPDHFRDQSGASPRSMLASMARSRKERQSSGWTARAQEAAVETARRKIAEVEADLVVAAADLEKAEGQIQEAKSAHQQALDELRDQAGAAKAQSGYRRAPRNREASGSCRRPPGWRLRPPRLQNRPCRRAFRHFSRPRKPAPKPRWPRPRWSWKRRLSVPA